MLPATLLKKLEYYFPNWQDAKYTILKEIKNWFRNLKNTFFKFIVLFLVVVIGYTILLTFVNYFWFAFQDTQVGRAFIATNSSPIIYEIFAALSGNTFTLAARLCVDTLIISLITGLAAQFFSLRRYFYYGYGILNHVCWFTAVAALTSFDLFERNLSFSFSAGLLLYFPPACCLLSESFKLTRLFLPELSIIFRVKNLKEVVKIAKIRNLDVSAKD